MTTSASDIELLQQRRLRRMKGLATGLLLAMALAFAATHAVADPPMWLRFVRAFAEAAMVGALADWFAVTALFRHPLGLPIPHTAIVPARKDAIGASLADFVERHFLTREVLQRRLAAMDFASHIGGWLSSPENARLLTRDAGAFIGWALQTIDDDTLRNFVRSNLHVGLAELQVTPLVGRVLDLLTTADRHQELMDTAVRVARVQLRENRYLIRAKIERESPWWMPGFVDREIYDKITSEIEQFLEGIGTDARHPARQKFNEGVRRFVADLKSDPEIIARGENMKEEVLLHPSVQHYLANVWSSVSSYLISESQNPDSPLGVRMRKGFVELGSALAANPPVRAQVNAWARDAIIYMMDNYRGTLSSVISDTVRSWDAQATTRRVELQIGRDLQFIRINGTIVGGLAGLGIYALLVMLGHA